MFEYNYENAKAAGLKVGAYFYTYAMSVEESRQDADKCLSYICGKTFDLPVYMDIEESEQERTFSKRLCTEIVLSFCELIDKGGYIAGVYANRSWLRSTMNEDTIRAVYEVWLAAWTTDKLPSEDHSDKYGVWQYTDSGKIPGIVSSFVDRDVCYKDYSLLTDTFVYHPHYFLDWDGSVLHTYNMRAGYKIYPPSVNPSRECDDDYEYSFLSWEGLDENTLSSESGGSFTALYSAEEHSYGEWVKVGNFKMERECEKCGHVQVEYLEDVFLGDSAVWDLNDGVVQITGTGEMKDGTSSDDFGWKSYAPEILSVEIEDGITGIGNYEFSDLPVLESISLPMTLLSIGDYAFSDSSLTEIRIPASVEYISPVAFENCELTIICFEGSYAQEYAVTHNVPYTLVSPSRIKSGSVSGVTWFFYDNGELIVAGKGSAEVISSKISSLKNTITGITFGELISSVGKSQFSGLPLLRSVVFLGDTPRTVGDYAFKDCPKLGSVSLPAGSDVSLNAFTGTLVFD